ncbi:glycosyltransferase family 2 protein [Microbulbifer agarilyticus]|uniref:glycosyltransferase family 2 protein n=1 Tax=Microbulbifer agarilyticus TaxID=260552 RepID=UPI001CD3792C|nr:glycosyltransferase family 2 protein [Microbulbifer agarilyticus]MCA0901400.1 glycosyltransferase family 2 protein [Microbulbifer agarilyticus]
MLNYVVKLRVLVSDYTFRLASRVPKSVRRHLKAIGAISKVFNFFRDDSYRDRYAFKMLKARQSQELEVIAARERDETGNLIHIVIDAQGSSASVVCKTVESVLNQAENTCKITLFASEVDYTEALYNSFPELHKIQFNLLDSGLGVVRALQEVTRLPLAKHEYVLFLNAGDMLNQYAISTFNYFTRVCEYPDAIYSDVATNIAPKPVFEGRPEFCPDYLYEYNYLPSSICFKCEQLRGVNLPGAGWAESVDAINHALAIVLSSYPDVDIRHIPYALVETEVSVEPGRPVSQLARETLELIGAQRGFEVRNGLSKETVCVQWNLVGQKPLVSIIIPTRDQVELLRQCIDSIIEKSTYQNIEILVINNNSVERETYEYFQALAKLNRVKIIDYPGKFNYSAINNFAVSRSSGEIIALVNNDIEVISPDWLETMVAHCARSDVGCVGAKLYYPDGTCQHGGVVIGYGGVAGHAHKNFSRASEGYMCRLVSTQNYTAVTAACLLIKKETFLTVGGLDEDNLTVAFNDVDLCLKVHELGLRNIWTPHAELYHHESVSRGSDKKGAARTRFMKEIEYMKKRWNTHEFKDPAYNENLTLSREDFALKTF